MKNLPITGNTTLYPPNGFGIVEIKTVKERGRVVSKFVSFKSLEKWVASVKSERITVADTCALCGENGDVREFETGTCYCYGCIS